MCVWLVAIVRTTDENTSYRWVGPLPKTTVPSSSVALKLEIYVRHVFPFRMPSEEWRGVQASQPARQTDTRDIERYGAHLVFLHLHPPLPSSSPERFYSSALYIISPASPSVCLAGAPSSSAAAAIKFSLRRNSNFSRVVPSEPFPGTKLNYLQATLSTSNSVGANQLGRPTSVHVVLLLWRPRIPIGKQFALWRQW